MNKLRIYLFGLITLVLFPLPAYFVLKHFEGWDLNMFLGLNELQLEPILLGLEFGVIYAALAIVILATGILKEEKMKQSKLLRQLNLNYFDMIVLSICAGVGEELLFRIGVQFYLGPIITTIIFVGLHGYYSYKNWRISLYGILITPFILLLAYAVDFFGIWFCIAAHFSYDFVLFSVFAKKKTSPRIS